MAGLLVVWYGSSVLTSLSTKEILSSFPHPVTVALIQQAVAFSCSLAGLSEGEEGSRSRSRNGGGGGGGSSYGSRWEMLSDWQLHAVTLQMSGVMVVSLVAYRWSLMAASIAFVHTVKTLGPVFTVAFARLLLGERLPLLHYLAVVPIVLGVALTSITDAEGSLVGLIAASISMSASALQAVTAKRLLKDRLVSSRADLFAIAALQAFFLLLPLSLAVDTSAWRQLPALEPRARVRIASWLVLNGLCSFVNQYVSLSVLDAMASPLSYALAQVMKRATVITVAMAYTWKPVTLLHGSGIALSLAGALCYQYAHVLYQPERGGRAADVEATEARYELVGIMKPSPGSKLTTVLEAEDSTDSTSSSEAGDETEASLLDIAAHRDGGRPGRGLGT